MMVEVPDNAVHPPDLATVFERYPGARAHFEAFPHSTQRGILEWIVQTKTVATRNKRIEERAHLVATNERAHQWRPKH